MLDSLFLSRCCACVYVCCVCVCVCVSAIGGSAGPKRCARTENRLPRVPRYSLLSREGKSAAGTLDEKRWIETLFKFERKIYGAVVGWIEVLKYGQLLSVHKAPTFRYYTVRIHLSLLLVFKILKISGQVQKHLLEKP